MTDAVTKQCLVELSPCQLTWHQGSVVDLPAVTLAAGETQGVMGPSGCGKSTWLRWLLGVNQPHVTIQGTICIAGEAVTDRPIEARHIGLVMQEQALFPHYTVYENLAFALAQQRLPRQVQHQRITEQLAAIGLADYGSRMPSALSGGERARVALLRAVLAQPRLILLDEPFNGLDEDRRRQICQWTYQFLTSHAIAAIIVSHDVRDLDGATTTLQWPQTTLKGKKND